jgi:hypothetical protein
MRTHLLRTIYPPAAAADVEPDTGCACNDECFAQDTTPPAARLRLDTAAIPANDGADDDDYYLGGYVGI